MHTIYKIKAALIGAVVFIGGQQTLHAQALGIEGEQYASIGIYIKDIQADTMVLGQDIYRNLVPASITKSVTSAAALTSLGGDWRFETPVDLVGTGKGDSFRGILRITGVGDPTLESGEFKDNQGFCDSIAAALARMKVKTLEGLQIIDDMTADGPVEQWEIDDVAWAYGAGLFGVNYKDNIFELNVKTGATKPHVPGLEINRKYESAFGNDQLRGIWSDDIWMFTGEKVRKNWTVTTTMPRPAKTLRYELTETLKENGIAVGTKKSGGANAVATRVYTHKSPVLKDILRSLMVRSDNMFAEGCLRALAPGKTRKAALGREADILKGLGVETQYITLRDGSGLARADRFSPQFLGNLLQVMAKGTNGSDYVALFPVAGKDGTMKSFMKGSRFEGKAAFKTGSMNGVQCYAGYILDNNNAPQYVVVIMANSFYCSRKELRQAIQNLLDNKIK